MKSFRIMVLGLIVSITSACQKFETLSSPAESSSGRLGCNDFKYTLAKEWSFHQEEKNGLDTTTSADPQLWQKSIERNPSLKNLSEDKRLKLSQIFSQYEDLVLKNAPEEAHDRLVYFRQLGLGDGSTPELARIQKKLNEKESEIKAVIGDAPTSCEALSGPGASPQPPSQEPPGTSAAEISLQKALRRVFTTTYQSCSVLNLQALRNSDDPVQGIAAKGRHFDGIGLKRYISSLPSVQKTHPYIRQQSYPSTCFSVKDKPLIYDYGGRPGYSNDDQSPLDFFRNSGSGTSVLGYDCSAFVFSVLMRAGLKTNPQTPFRARDIEAANSRHFVNPSAAGFTCLEKISFESYDVGLRIGDIAAITGHVLMIHSVGEDPLAIADKKTEAECDSINPERFDFRVIQSGPSKNGIGVHVYEGADYLRENGEMKLGFKVYAKALCLARVTGKSRKPSVRDFSIVRHKFTPECKGPPVLLAKESCVASCNY